MDRLPLKVLLPELADRQSVLNFEEDFRSRHVQLTNKTVSNELELEMLEVALDWIGRLSVDE